jgi:3-dehydroquinate dehydratase-2
VYGTIPLDAIVQAMIVRGRELGITIQPFQSNHEGELIDWFQMQAEWANAIIINPGGRPLQCGPARRS